MLDPFQNNIQKSFSEDMAELVELLRRMGFIAGSRVCPDRLEVEFTPVGIAGLCYMNLVLTKCEFDYPSQKQACLRILFDRYCNKEIAKAMLKGTDLIGNVAVPRPPNP